MLRISTAPERVWLIKSVSDPSWFAGKTRISRRPLVASRMRSGAPESRVLICCPTDLSVASLKLNSAAQAGRLRIAISGTAVDAARTFLRERVLVDLLIASSLGCFSAFLLAKEFYHSPTFAR